MMKTKQKGLVNFLFKIVFPTILVIGLFVIAMFVIFLPAFEQNLINGKREMIHELTNTTWSIFEKHEQDFQKGLISREEAQRRAISEIETIRYGDENKDYFWITNEIPEMIMHPYRKDLNGKDLRDFKDPSGKRLFVEMAEAVKEKGYGYVDYMWQWKDDESRIVPKLSYVREFEPWGWIIGTGIYIEDVKAEIKKLESRIISISFGIIAIAGILMLFIILQSLNIENKRVHAEHSLRESREKYRTLVEAATEGSIMILDHQIVYSNLPVQKMLGYSATELNDLQLSDLFPDKHSPAIKKITSENREEKSSQFFDTALVSKSGTSIDVNITISAVEFGIKKGYTLIINNREKSRIVEEELQKNKEQLYSLTHTLNIGIFRTTYGKRGEFLDANPTALEIFGYHNIEQLRKKSIYDLFVSVEEKKSFIKDLSDEKSIRNRTIKISRDDGSFSFVSVSVVVSKDKTGNFTHCDGIIQDITSRKETEEEQANLISDLQTSQFFLNQPVKYFSNQPLLCSINDSIKKAADLMTRQHSDAIIVASEEGKPLGIVTGSDLRARVIVDEKNTTAPVSEIMSAPIICIEDKALVVEAILLMNKRKIKHLLIKNSKGEIEKIISADLLREMQFQSYALFLKDINNTKNVEDLLNSRKQLPVLIKAMIDNGVSAKNINRVMTIVSDAITEKLIEFALAELGEPPARFAFITLGSEGREEQTLKTDQDNAIIYEDLNDTHAKKAEEYFLKLGKMVCTWLDEVGYSFCEGQIMAMNPKWCKPISVWKKYFKNWIVSSEPQDLLEINIFFDLRCLHGDKGLSGELTDFIDQLIESHPPFLLHMTENTLLYKPPLNMFGNIVLKDTPDKKQILDLKDAMVPIVGLARNYALKYHIHETNTLQRLDRLYKQKIFSDSGYKDLIDAYQFLMQLRLKNQANLFSEKKEPDNKLNPKVLTTVELSLLKKVFSGMSDFQSKLSYDFKGRN